MTNKPKNIGTAAETAVVRVLLRSGWPYAERRALKGTYDCGDITGTPQVCWEVKGGKAAKDATDLIIGRWLGETERERVNARADYGVLVVQRRGVGFQNADRWWAWMSLEAVTRLADPEAHAAVAVGLIPVRIRLDDAIDLLHEGGYGDPEEAAA